jgi:hypothetical protein
MSKEDSVNLAKLIRDERQKWRDSHLLAPGALGDFQEFSEEAFHSLRDKYYRPAELVAEVGLRARLRGCRANPQCGRRLRQFSVKVCECQK